MNKKHSKHKKHKTLVGRISKVVLIALLSLVFIIIVAGSVFYIYKDDIGERLLLSLNTNHSGEISFSDISFDPLIHFPSASVQLHDFLLTDKSQQDSIQKGDTIATLKSVYAAVHISDLIAGKINISKITLNDGQLNLIQYPDSTINLLKALNPISDNTVLRRDTSKSQQIDSTALDINLDGITLNNIRFKLENFTHGGQSQIDITNLKASAQIQNNIINIGWHSEFLLKDLAITDKIHFENKILKINSSIVYDQHNETLQISDGNISLEELDFMLSGTVDISENPDTDLKIEGDVKGVKLFKLFLSEYGLKNLKSGETYFKGTIQGSFKNKIPLMKFNFGLKDVNISIPQVGNQISNLNLEGSFNSGVLTDFSQASLKIKNLKGQLPGGYINASLSLNNFTTPAINLFWDLKTDVTGFDKIFKTESLDSLSGNLTFYNEIIGTYNPKAESFNLEKDSAVVLFDHLSFNIPGILEVKNLDGELQNIMDTLSLTNLQLNANNTDLNLNGKIINLNFLLTNEENDIWADLRIKSDTFDLPAIFSFEPRVGTSFPYKIKNIDMLIHAESNTKKLTEFDSTPEIDIEISDMQATIENLFPPISIHKGEMKISERDSRLLLTFNNFDLETAQAKLFTDVEYFSPATDPDKITVDVIIKELNPGKLLLWQQDSVAAFMDGELNGTFSTNLEIGLDTFDFKTFNLDAKALDYTTEKDTFNIEHLNLKARNIYYSSSEETHILNTLLAEIKLEIEHINSNYFKEDWLAFDITAQNGVFDITPEKSQFFGKEGQGNYKFSPATNVPMYEIKYTVNQFHIDDFLANMLSDTLLTGKMDLDIDVTLIESSPGDLFSNMNGAISLNGKDMTFHGVDIDNIIEKYNKSQKFDLLDVGAILVAGPIGLALTKGSDFANLALGNMGESSHITNFISEWEMINGKINLKDVAFATERNRIAGIGWIDLASDSLEVTIAVLDNKGCSVLSQTLSGPIDSLQHSEIKIVSTVLGPVTNLVNGALGKDCKVIYDGKLPHPLKKK